MWGVISRRLIPPHLFLNIIFVIIIIIPSPYFIPLIHPDLSSLYTRVDRFYTFFFNSKPVLMRKKWVKNRFLQQCLLPPKWATQLLSTIWYWISKRVSTVHLGVYTSAHTSTRLPLPSLSSHLHHPTHFSLPSFPFFTVLLYFPSISLSSLLFLFFVFHFSFVLQPSPHPRSLSIFPPPSSLPGLFFLFLSLYVCSPTPVPSPTNPQAPL